MLAKEQVVCSAYAKDPETGSFPKIVLIPTDQKIHSITSVVTRAVDSEGGSYFVKPMPDGDREPSQLEYLRSLGVAVPSKVFVNRECAIMATPFSGSPLSYIRGDLQQDELAVLLKKAGEILKGVHRAFEVMPPVDGILNNSFTSTAHIVDNFFYKQVGLTTHQEYVSHKDRVNARSLEDTSELGDQGVDFLGTPFIPIVKNADPQMRRLVGFSNELAVDFLSRLRPNIKLSGNGSGEYKPYLYLPDSEFYEGDYKSDNLLVTKNGTSWEVVIIDPVIGRGSNKFDLAKFAGRFLLEKHSPSDADLLPTFFEGYGNFPANGNLEYGPFTFADLARLDMLNVLKSYFKRWVRGDRGYRLVRALDSENFCLETRNLLESQNIPG